MVNRDASEKEFQAQVVELATWLGWSVYHTFDSRRSAAGFPDLTLVRDGEMIMAEVKSQTGRVRSSQLDWYARLLLVQDAAPDAFAVRVWRPSDMPAIESILARRLDRQPPAVGLADA